MYSHIAKPAIILAAITFIAFACVNEDPAVARNPVPIPTVAPVASNSAPTSGAVQTARLGAAPTSTPVAAPTSVRTSVPAQMVARISDPTPKSVPAQTVKPGPATESMSIPAQTSAVAPTVHLAVAPVSTLTPTLVPDRTPTPTLTPVAATAFAPTPAQIPAPVPVAVQTATPTSESTYLTDEIPPCTPIPGSSADPCEPTPDWAPAASAGGSSSEPPLHLDFLLNDLPTSPILATHFILRGTYIPGTVRCTSGHNLRLPAFESTDDWSDHLVIYCFADVRVNAYLLGSGPSTLTVIVRTSPYALPGGGDEEYGLEQLESRRLAYERALSEGGRFGYEEPLRGYIPPSGGTGWLHLEDGPDGLAAIGPTKGIGGREAVLFIYPSINLSVEAWQVSYRWDVQRRADGTVVATHPYRERFNFETHGSLLEMELPTLKQAVTTAHQTRVTANGGRIGADESLPMLQTDANKLRQYFSDTKVGAYATGVPTPAPPPPVTCGTAVANPRRQPSPRPRLQSPPRRQGHPPRHRRPQLERRNAHHAMGRHQGPWHPRPGDRGEPDLRKPRRRRSPATRTPRRPGAAMAKQERTHRRHPARTRQPRQPDTPETQRQPAHGLHPGPTGQPLKPDEPMAEPQHPHRHHTLRTRRLDQPRMAPAGHQPAHRPHTAGPRRPRQLAGPLAPHQPTHGEIPASLTQLPSLEDLRLRTNQLTGCLPPTLRNLPKNDLHQLNLQNCPTP